MTGTWALPPVFEPIPGPRIDLRESKWHQTLNWALEIDRQGKRPTLVTAWDHEGDCRYVALRQTFIDRVTSGWE